MLVLTTLSFNLREGTFFCKKEWLLSELQTKECITYIIFEIKSENTPISSKCFSFGMKVEIYPTRLTCFPHHCRRSYLRVHLFVSANPKVEKSQLQSLNYSEIL